MKSTTFYAIFFIITMFIIAMCVSCSSEKHFTKLGKHDCLVMHKPVHKETKGLACHMVINH